MVSFMHHWALQSFIEAAEYLGRSKDVEKYTIDAGKVKESCENVLWDGDWYLRGFTGKGIKIGTSESEEGKIFLNAQSWAVMSGAAQGERAEKAMDSVHKHLYSQYGCHLLWPAFSKPNDDIGYVTRVYRGVKENGAIFSHPNPWVVIAECILGRGTKAMKLYDSMLPYNQNNIIETRQAEPYSYCQFIMGNDHTAFGRARHPWLTGSAGWYYTAATRWILGVRLTFNEMIIDPCIPSEWTGFKLTRKWRGATYNITVTNPDNVEKGVKEISLNGRKLSGNLPAQLEGSVNTVEVVMG